MTFSPMTSMTSIRMFHAFVVITCFLYIISTATATSLPNNDKCVNATDATSSLIAMLPFSTRVNTKGATTDFTTGTCSIMSTDTGVWYTLMGKNQNVVVDVTNQGSTLSFRSGIAVAVFTGSCNNLICLKSSTDQTEYPAVQLSWNATIGQQYYIIVAGSSASTGTFNINIEVCII